MADIIGVKHNIEVAHRLFELPSPQYLAGFFDADGCVMAYARECGQPEYVQVVLTNQCKTLLDVIQDAYGGRFEHSRNCWLLRMSTRPAAKFLIDIEPYVIIKKAQVAAAREIQTLPQYDPTVRTRRAELAQRLRDLKKEVA